MAKEAVLLSVHLLPASKAVAQATVSAVTKEAADLTMLDPPWEAGAADR